MTSLYVVASPTPPTIVCPDWCACSQAEHVEDLVDWEGFVIHHSADIVVREGLELRLLSSTFVDGTPDPSCAATVDINGASELTAEDIGLLIVALESAAHRLRLDA
jgi:hypothetical protein